MAILSSIFLGAEGTYQIQGVEVTFNPENQGEAGFSNNWFGRSVNLCLNNPIIPILTFGYLHVFIHEIGHALAARIENINSKINIYTSTCRGNTYQNSSVRNTLLLHLAGPIAGMAWETAKLIGAIAIATLFPSPIGLGLGAFIGTGAAFWLFGEIAYALIGDGDWTYIRHHIT